MNKWEVLGTEYPLNERWMKVRKEKVKLPNGKIFDDYYLWESPDAALVVPILEDGRMLLVQQYKHGGGKYVLEFPAGIVEQGEDAISAVARELEEETGYSSSDISQIACLMNNPTKETGRVYVYLAQGCSKTHDTSFDESEDIQQVILSVDEVEAKILAGEIEISACIAAFFMARKQL
jgi:8-oxo-dGTP pyrophosphatase MutT (NUDIX family)